MAAHVVEAMTTLETLLASVPKTPQDSTASTLLVSTTLIFLFNNDFLKKLHVC